MNAYKEALIARLNLYSLTGRILVKEIDEELLHHILHDENIQPFFPNFTATPENNTDNLAHVIEEILNVDFTHISLVGLIPYESFYRRDDGMVESGINNPVAQFYQQYGFEINLAQARAVSNDHIGIELEFMASLIKREYDAVLNNDLDYAKQMLLAQKLFLESHLLQWATLYLEKVEKEAFTTFYKDTARLTLDLIMSDYEYIIEECNE